MEVPITDGQIQLPGSDIYTSTPPAVDSSPSRFHGQGALSAGRHFYALLLTLAVAWPIANARASAADYVAPFRIYSTADGMSQAEVGGLAQDQSGYLWMSTLRGLNRFDGKEFVSFTIGEGLRQNHLTAVTVDHQNRVWAGDASGGISLLENNTVVQVLEPPPGPISEISGLVSVPEGLIVSTRGNGVWQLIEYPSHIAWQAVLNAPLQVDQVAAGDKHLYLRSGSRLWRASRSAEIEFEPIEQSARLIARAPTGGIWIVDAENNAGPLEALDRDGTPVSPEAAHFMPSAGGGVWQVVDGFLVGARGDRRKLPTAEILTLFEDREGTLWLGSPRGLIRFLGFRFRHYPLSDSRDGRMIWSISQDRRGRHWFGSDDGLLIRTNQGELVVVGEENGLPTAPVRDIVMEPGGQMLAAVRGHGVYRIVPDSLNASLLEGTDQLQPLDLALTPDGALWVGTLRSGVLRIDLATGVLKRSELPHNTGVYALAAQDNDTIWAGVSNFGLVRMAPGAGSTLSYEVLPGSESLLSNFYGQISMQGPRSAWISTADGGVFFYNDGTARKFGADTPLSDQNVYLLEQLADGTLVIGADAGLYQLNIENGRLYRHQPLNGFLAIESNVHATFFDASGDLWIGTVAGATRMDTSLAAPEVPQPQPWIVRMRTGSDRPLTESTEPIKSDDGGVIVDFRAVSLLDPDALEFSYQLTGVDKGFSDADTLRTVRYSSLGAGAYDFMVRTRFAGNAWSQPASRHFSVLPPIWLRPWFIMLAFALAMAVIRYMIRLRTRQIARVNQRLRAQVAERTKSIEEARVNLEQSNQLLEYQANFDELTGLFNRRSFGDKLAQAWSESLRGGQFSYLMCMDLDQFKIVNDTCGHAAGDRLLCQVADLVRAELGDSDILGRLGGDEFGLIVGPCSREAALQTSEVVRETVEELQFPWDNEVFRIGVSIGVVAIDHRLGDVNELQQLADTACYTAKEAGRNQVHMVDGEKDLTAEHRGEMRWVQRLHDAMVHNRFALYGQRIMPLRPAPAEPERMEILLRMRDPATRKLIPPGAFLPAAERYGLGIKLDEWVVTNLLRSLFVHESFRATSRRYWVNLSGASVGDKKFSQTLISLMKQTALPAGMVNFEITETAVIRSVKQAAYLIDALGEMGCSFALDDFGSGLSSFGYLKTLKVDYLKIDGMFVRDIVNDETDRIFVKSIIDIAHTLNIQTIAEFVENDEILSVVKSLGADFAQGYGVHRPELLAPSFTADPVSLCPPPVLRDNVAGMSL